MAFNRLSIGKAALAVGLAAIVVGCAQPTTYRAYYHSWHRSKLASAADQGAVLTEIRGNPFNASKQEVDKTITDTMYKSHFGPPVPFVTEKPQDYTSPYRVVILFNPDITMNSYELCTAKPEPAAPVQGEIRVAAAFCANEVHETSVWGTVGKTSSPKDPEFQALIRNMTTQLFPNFSPDDDGNDSFRNS